MEDAKRQKLEVQKKGLESNRTLCLLLCAFLVYVTFKDFKANPGSPLFYAAMSILFLQALMSKCKTGCCFHSCSNLSMASPSKRSFRPWK